MTTAVDAAPSPGAATSDTSSSFPSWTFQIPVDVANVGFQIAIYGQAPPPPDQPPPPWMYWDPSAGGYTDFSAGEGGMDTAPLIDATPDQGSYTSPVSFTVNLPATQQLQSGVVAMFIGGSSGISVTAAGEPASPTTSTNAGDLYSIFEFTYAAPPPPNGSGPANEPPTLDIDISNVDQVGFTYTVQTTGNAPFPLSLVGSTVPQATVFSQFGAAFPAGTPFNECLVYGQETIGGNVTQLRLLAPQDVLQAIVPPVVPSYTNPTGAPTDSEPFAENTYFYLASETSPTGETIPSPGVFGGYLLSPSGQPQASQIEIGWLPPGAPLPGVYTPKNPSATGINLYRASGPSVDAPAPGSTTPPPTVPATGYGLLTSMTIAAWNQQADYVFVDDSTSVGSQAPMSSSYGFSALSTWFDAPLQQFFENFAANPFALYQSNQDSGSNGTLWTGTVVDVTPNAGDAITALTYVDENGNAQSIAATWTWGDGTQTYKVLQLVGNAYDPNDLSSTSLSGATGLAQGEYQGAVVNIYFPYFTGNTGLTSIDFGGGTYTLPPAPPPLPPPSSTPWLTNASYTPSQMVFGCAGAFATPADPEATAQQSSFPDLAGNALPSLQNVIVSALNRGIATGYGFAIEPLGYTCQYGFSQAPATLDGGTLPAGTYTYYLSGTLNDGSESTLTWPQTITLTEESAVVLTWLPQPPALYTQANVYRQTGTATIELIGTVANTANSLATTFTDTNALLPAQPTNGAPFLFYPSWNDPSAAGFVNSNLFSAFLHQNLSADPDNGINFNGLVYGYPFDDQGNFSTNISYGTEFPTSITFAISTLE
jgi:hypothetical protein